MKSLPLNEQLDCLVNLASGMNYVEALVYLFRDCDITQDTINEALDNAVGWGNIGAVKFLLDKGGDVNYLSVDGDYLLESAIYYDKYDVAKLLLSYGAIVNNDVIDRMDWSNTKTLRLIKKYIRKQGNTDLLKRVEKEVSSHRKEGVR